jgi:hypothetical protein
MTYACPTWECAAYAQTFNLQCLQNRIVRAIGNLDIRTLVHELHVAFKIPYVLCKQLQETAYLLDWLGTLLVSLSRPIPCGFRK